MVECIIQSEGMCLSRSLHPPLWPIIFRHCSQLESWNSGCPVYFELDIAVDSAPVMSPFDWQGKLRQGLDSCELMLGSSDLKLEIAAGQGVVTLCSPCKITPLYSKGKNSSIPDSAHLSILHRILELHRKSVWR